METQTQDVLETTAPVNQHTDFIHGLRNLANWLEVHPDFNLCDPRVTLNEFVYGKQEFAEAARAFGSATKQDDGAFFMLRKDFGGRVKIDINIRHEIICERVLVSTEVVPEHIIPAQAATLVPERVVEKYEWRCPESILAPTEAA